MKFRLVAIILSFRVTVMPPLAEVETTQCFPGKKHTYNGGQTGYVLEKDPEDRLGHTGGANEILRHEWFSDIDL